MERVSIVRGRRPIIFVAPHGPNDPGTAEIAEKLSDATNGYAVINRGWERSKDVDIFNDKANCNSIKHLQEDVVKDEFLDPLINFMNQISKSNLFCHIFFLHGINSKHLGLSDVDVVVGFGQGKPPRITCNERVLTWMITRSKKYGLNMIVGEPGGKFAGWSRDNLNQYFQYDINVSSVQLEIDREWRIGENIDIFVDCFSNTLLGIETSHNTGDIL